MENTPKAQRWRTTRRITIASLLFCAFVTIFYMLADKQGRIHEIIVENVLVMAVAVVLTYTGGRVIAADWLGRKGGKNAMVANQLEASDNRHIVDNPDDRRASL